MAVNPSTKWPTRTTAAAPAYPYGSSKDETTPGANNGTPYEKARADDIFGLQQALLKFAGIVPSGNADTAQASQYLEALLDVAMGGGFFEDGGAADTYLFNVLSGTDRQGPAVYTDGMQVSAVIANTNTGASTINVNSLGAKNIFYKGVALTAGLLASGGTVVLIYDDANNRFDLLSSDVLFMDLFKNQVAKGQKTFEDQVNFGKNGGGSTVLEFFDDTNNSQRSLRWDDGDSRFEIDDSGGVSRGIATLNRTETLENKSLGTGTKIALGSDADGDIYYRDAGILKRLAKGTDGQSLELVSGLPAWITNSSFSVHKNGTNQGISDSANTKVTWSTELFDTNSDFASNKFTPSVAGKYLLSSNVSFISAVMDGKAITIGIYKNGAVLHEAITIGSGAGTQAFQVIAVVDANGTSDYFEIFIEHNMGLIEDVGGASESTWFTGSRIA